MPTEGRHTNSDRASVLSAVYYTQYMTAHGDGEWPTFSRRSAQVRAACNCAQRLAERRVMMQNWADYLDRLESVEIIAKHADTRY